MRKTLLAVLILMLAAAGASEAGVLDFGIKGGLNIAGLRGDTDELTGWKTGFAGGVSLDWGITPLFGLQPELLYVQNGATEKLGSLEWNFKVNYFQIPLLAKVDLPVGGALIPVLYAGPYVGILLDSKMTISEGSNEATVGLEDWTASYDTGFAFGAALEYAAGPGKVTIEGRYNLGLTELDEGIGAGLTGDPDIGKVDIKNRSWMIMAGYTF